MGQAPDGDETDHLHEELTRLECRLSGIGAPAQHVGSKVGARPLAGPIRRMTARFAQLLHQSGGHDPFGAHRDVGALRSTSNS